MAFTLTYLISVLWEVRLPTFTAFMWWTTRRRFQTHHNESFMDAGQQQAGLLILASVVGPGQGAAVKHLFLCRTLASVCKRLTEHVLRSACFCVADWLNKRSVVFGDVGQVTLCTCQIKTPSSLLLSQICLKSLWCLSSEHDGNLKDKP